MGTEALADRILWWILGVLLLVAAFFGGKFFNNSDKSRDALWDRVNKLQAEVNEVKVMVAGNYVTHDQQNKFEQRIYEELRAIREAIEAAVSRG